MKWLFLGIGIAAAAVAAAAAAVGISSAVRAHRDTRPEDCVDGGVRHFNSGEDAPKVIESDDITEFHCTFSLYAKAESTELESGVYSFSAVNSGETVSCDIDWHDRYGKGDDHTFSADGSFLAKLQKIVKAHDLAKHNGYTHSVSGLPDMYGARLDVRYASGESIYAYDNQHMFLSMDAAKELFLLFDSYSENK